MANQIRVVFTTILILISAPLTAIADESCRAHYTFDGNLSDSGGNGYNGAMLNGAKPNFVEGVDGQALVLDGSSAMTSSVDLNSSSCPLITFTAWIKAAEGRSNQTEYLISTGYHSTPGMYIADESITLHGSNYGISQKGAARPASGWTFIAGVYDHLAATFRLHVGTRNESEPLAIMNEPDPTLWVGAFNDDLAWVLSGLAIDDLRIYDKAFTVEEIEMIRKTGGSPPESVGFVPYESGAWEGRSCEDHPDCGLGAYCAFDNTCHPDNHAPKRELELTVIDQPVDMILPEVSPTEEPPPAPTPIVTDRTPRPTGSETVTEYTGSLGDMFRRIDLVNDGNFLNMIAWDEKNDRPCKLGISHQPAGGMAGADETVDFICTGGLGIFLQSTAVSVSAGTYVHAVEVCNNRRNSNYRLKGVRIYGAKINTDGSIATNNNSDAEELSNCTDWAPKRSCPSNQVATGVVVLANESGGEDKAGITGLRLICHAVEIPGAK